VRGTQITPGPPAGDPRTTTAAPAPAFPATDLPVPPAISPEKALGTAQWGMIAFLLSEVAFFGTLIVTFLAFLGEYPKGKPTPGEVLRLPLVIVTTLCLLSSSATVYMAERGLRHAEGARSEGVAGDSAPRRAPSAFLLWWAATIALGVIFLLGTAYEWREMIVEHKLTISRNIFGTTYYTLVGFHAAHVTVGVIAMLVVLSLALSRELTAKNAVGVEMVSWYWHFVDGVWVVVFTVVYLIAKFYS
jgi:cytochrome c oxidase subunit 3/cytochrome o ubiquinol oxidase subunit 3